MQTAVSTIANHIIMKKIYVLLLVSVGTTLSATAQPFQKGDKLLGGSIGFASSKTTASNPANKYTGFGISPSIGFFTSAKSLTGFSVNYGYAKSEQNGETKTNSIGASVYQQHWNSLGKSFYFIAEGRLAGSYQSSKSTFTGSYFTESKGFQGGFQINPGIAYRINRRLVLDAFFSNFVSIAYAHSNVKRNPQFSPTSEYKTDDFGITTGFSNFTTDNIQFGFRYIL